MTMRRIKISVPEEMYAALVREATLADRPVATMARILLGQRLRADVPLTHGFGGPEVGRAKVVVEDGGITVEGHIDDPAMAAALAPDLRGVSIDEPIRHQFAGLSPTSDDCVISVDGRRCGRPRAEHPSDQVGKEEAPQVSEPPDGSDSRVRIEDGKVVVAPPPLRPTDDGHRHRFTELVEDTKKTTNGVTKALYRCRECPMLTPDMRIVK